MSKSQKKVDNYYPLRWKVADFVENIIILHRTRAALVLAALGIFFVIIGLFVLGWRPWGSSDETAEAEAAEQVTNDVPQHDETTLEQELAELPEDTVRPIATTEQFALTTPGTVIELGSTTMRLTGGLTNDVAADRSVARALELFNNREFLDAQVLGDFGDDEQITIRVVEPVFLGDTAEINPDLTPLFVDVADAVRSSGEWTVEVVGHTPDQALSETRAQAAADQLVAQGVAANIVTTRGAGGTERILDFNSRVDFILTQ